MVIKYLYRIAVLLYDLTMQETANTATINAQLRFKDYWGLRPLTESSLLSFAPSPSWAHPNRERTVTEKLRYWNDDALRAHEGAEYGAFALQMNMVNQVECVQGL